MERRKARAIEMPLGSGPGRKAVFSLAPPMIAGGLLTIMLVQTGMTNAIPGVWLLLYGTGVITGGMIPKVRFALDAVNDGV